MHIISYYNSMKMMVNITIVIIILFMNKTTAKMTLITIRITMILLN